MRRTGLDDVEDRSELLQLLQRQRRHRAARHRLQLHRGQRAGDRADGQQSGDF